VGESESERGRGLRVQRKEERGGGEQGRVSLSIHLLDCMRDLENAG
jgi:hypothetical protein